MECLRRRDFGEPRGAQPGCVIREQRRLDLGRVVLGRFGLAGQVHCSLVGCCIFFGEHRFDHASPHLLSINRGHGCYIDLNWML